MIPHPGTGEDMATKGKQTNKVEEKNCLPEQ